MPDYNPQELRSKAIKVGDRTWWVGHVLENDVFQCHVYLLEQGRQSVLFDPGSLLTFALTKKKIEQIIPFDHIKYFICHHQDPDITASLPLIDEAISRDDASIICHGRAKALLRHYGLQIDFQLIEEQEWKLELEDRTLEFIFTPYAHFPGAFCSFDTSNGNLFSSDLFGGFTEEFSLYAKDESYFESMRPFHEHYMPSNQILNYALTEIEKYPVRQILPQHGSIISQPLVGNIISRLKKLDCGLFLMGNKMEEIFRLSELNKILHEIMDVIVHSREFKDIAKGLLEITQSFFPTSSLEFYTRLSKDRILHLAPEDRYRGKLRSLPDSLANIIGSNFTDWQNQCNLSHGMVSLSNYPKEPGKPALILPLVADDSIITGIAILHLDKELSSEHSLSHVLNKLRLPLQVAVEREAIFRAMDIERQLIYDRASKDPLTQLYTRLYMHDSIMRFMELQDRDQKTQIVLALLDVDHFKKVNDTFGHNQGDTVLKEIAALILEQVRSSDLPVRLGGEEFGVFLLGASNRDIRAFAERLREGVSDLVFPEPMEKHTVTVSIGLATRRPYETLEDFIEQADRALYEAKNNGRNQVREAR